jgi:NAD-dependent SIR2 family protein deacetylase
MEMEISIQDEINQIKMKKPHVVILGAGASCAAFSDGDKYDQRIPLMNNFVEILELGDLLHDSHINFRSDNFEDIYSKLYKSKEYDELRSKLEKRIYVYFKQMQITDNPTIYDHLLLSLRGKDIVATFNWDPFLIQAYQRNASRFTLPRLLFLHGNVEVGYCEKDKIAGINGNNCSRCGEILKPTKLLYPIDKKDYHINGFIYLQWKELQYNLTNAFMITIFGYSSPKSDVSAIELMKLAWGDIKNREMEQTEMIDIKSEDTLCNTWQPFIHTHHYDIHRNFYKSWIPNHPRRTGEAHINQYYYAKFINNNPIPKDLSFLELWKWLKPLQDVEKQSENNK